ncbi:hypothetical protein HN51_018210 [Arachis hypogaea]|uniref:WAT1-related protein n=2 Tax=Arachis TaxID=3817 RepID=A0A445BSU4_ARAHY|nr:WAT1-related protein At1g70260-like [Arachis duranensis]XP_025612809.1 WAT1-related protein At1g70260 [Arachis hypogaea]QHO29812.1 WAT1-related protein [Arachis hypogaea]RYR41698.1 hypothetical protein Ahy_A08g038110 [Arachis hypogaea]
MESKITKIWEIMPFIVMVMMEGCTIALTIFAKTELNNGMSPFVFIVYTNALATIILFPSSFLLHNNGGRKEPTPSFTFSLFMRFLLLGFTGITMTQSFSFLGLSYSSPILVCAMGLLIPTFNFLLSLISRERELNLRSSGFQVEVIGVMVSIIGGVEAEFFKGPLIRPTSSDDKLQFTNTNNNNNNKPLFVFSSVPEFWVLGGILLASASLSVALWNFIQKKTVKEYSEPMKAVAYYSLIGTILSAIVAWIVERDDATAWKLNHDMQLILILLTALFGGVIRPNIQIWFTRMKGPFYVPLFKPFGIAFATTFGVCIFPNSLHYGSVLGAAIIGMGYYTIMWGQMKGEEEKRSDESSDNLDKKIPLLQEKMEEV